MLKTLMLVPVIMLCATVGTIGLIKLIQKFAPDIVLPRETILKNLEKEVEKSDRN